MSLLKATWWRPAAALAVLALAVSALSVTGTGVAQAGGGGSVTIDPASKDIPAGGEGAVSIKIAPPSAGTSIWIIEVGYDPAVAQVKLSGQDPVCTAMASPGQGIAQASGCDIKASGDHGSTNDTLVAFGGWVQNDNGTPRGFTTEQTAATFTFVAVGASGAHTDLTTSVNSMLGPNGEDQGSTPPSNGAINITEGNAGTQIIWGNLDCSADGIKTRDNQALLRNVLVQAALSQTEPCPDIGATVTVDGTSRIWGNLDCSADGIKTRDNQALLRNVLVQAALSQTEPCPDIGATVTVN